MDIALLAHAKDYIDDMAKGIHPLTKAEIPENDTLNNVRISRCLFFVSEVLEEVIANGGVSAPAPAKREKKVEFAPEEIDWSAFTYSEIPTGISQITKQINDCRPENMKHLKVTALTDWLVDIGLLTVITTGDKKRKEPTRRGVEMGILLEERTGMYGTYTAVLYNENAQRFIIDNLSAVIAGGFNKKRSREETAPEN
ncbi:MAG: hypothetical protein IJI67_05190 [Clostridia bacterium]|nr:hypothetical protein [Clostridia bacterium]